MFVVCGDLCFLWVLLFCGGVPFDDFGVSGLVVSLVVWDFVFVVLVVELWFAVLF